MLRLCYETPPRVLANIVYYCAVPPIEEAMEKHLKIYPNATPTQKELLEKYKKMEQGEYTAETMLSFINSSSINIKRTYPLTPASADKLMVYSVIKDLTKESMSADDINKKINLPIGVVELAIMAMNREYKAITHSVPEIHDKDYIQKRDSTCYRIAKKDSVNVYGDSFKSYIKRIHDLGGADAYIKWFEERYTT